MSRYSRTAIIRLNLYYWSEAQARLRIEQVFNHLDALITKHHRHPIFEHLIGYIYAVEQGIEMTAGVTTSMQPTSSMAT